MLEGREGQTTGPKPSYRPCPPDLWRIPDAFQHIAELLRLHSGHLSFERCLPPIPQDAPDRLIRVRAALASSFVVALEMVRNGDTALEQEQPFGTIMLAPRVTVAEQVT